MEVSREKKGKGNDLIAGFKIKGLEKKGRGEKFCEAPSQKTLFDVGFAAGKDIMNIFSNERIKVS